MNTAFDPASHDNESTIWFCTPSRIVEHLSDVISHARQRDRLRCIWVIAPGVASARGLSFAMSAKQALANVHFITPDDAIERVLATECPPVVSPEFERESIRRCLARKMPQRFSRCSSLDMVDSIAQALRAARRQPPAALRALVEQEGLSREVISVCDAVESELNASYITRHAAALQASMHLQRSLAQLPHVVWVTTDPLQYPYNEFAMALSRATTLEILATEVGESLLDLDMRTMISGMMQRTEASPVSQAVEHITCVIAPDPISEVDLAIEAILREANGGIAFADMALLLPDRATYGDIARERLLMAEIPFVDRGSSRLAASVPGRFCLALLEVLRCPDSRDALLAFLRAAPLRTQEGSLAPRDRWLDIVRKRRMRGGAVSWIEALGRARANRSLETSSAESDIERWIYDSFDTCLKKIESMSSSRYSTWHEWTTLLAGALTSFLGEPSPSNGWPESHIAAAAQLGTTLTALAELDQTRSSELISIDIFFAALHARLTEQRLQNANATGVYVGLIDEAVGTPLQFVALCGMNDGAYPNVPHLNAIVSAVSVEDDPKDAEAQRRQFLTILQSCTRVQCSASLASIRMGRPLFLSPWFLEVASRRAGRVVTIKELLTPDPAWTWLTYLPSTDAMTSPGRGEVVHANRELDTMAAMRLDGDADAFRDERVERGWEVLRSRASTLFTEFDGNVSGSANKIQNTHVYSPTSLESWSRCPFSFFLSKVLHVSDRDKVDPEERTESPLDLGKALHAVLERVIDAEIRGEIIDDIAACVDAVFSEFVSIGVFYPGAFLDGVKAHTVRRVRNFQHADRTWRISRGVAPQSVELAFGEPKASPLEVPCDDGGTVAFHGSIDRIDASLDRRDVWVSDYKVKDFDKLPKCSDPDNPFQFGTALQLDIYGLAAKQQFPNANVHAGYWSLRDDAQGYRRQDIAVDDARIAAFRALISAIVNQIARGIFPLVPRSANKDEGCDNCQYCQFHHVCPQGRAEQWEAKRDQPELQTYQRITLRAPQGEKAR